MALQIDKVDYQIIELLQQDGRTPFTKISKELGISEATVRNRLARLKKEGVIQIVAVADPFKVGLDIAAIIKIKAQVDKVDTVAEALQRIEDIWYIALNTGDATFDVEAYLPSVKHLNGLLQDKIFKIDGIKQTETSIVLSYLKRNYRWKLLHH